MENDLGSFSVFRELTVRGLSPALDGLGDAIQQNLPAHWRRDKAKEQENALMFGDKSLLVFERDGSDGLPAAGVAVLTEGEMAEVINIVPLEKSQLSAREYNAILVEFTNSAIRPATVALDIKYVLTDDKKPFTAWVSPAAGQGPRSYSLDISHPEIAFTTSHLPSPCPQPSVLCSFLLFWVGDGNGQADGHGRGFRGA